MKELLRKLSNFFNLSGENRMAHMASGAPEAPKPIEAAKETDEATEVSAESLDQGVKRVESSGDKAVDLAKERNSGYIEMPEVTVRSRTPEEIAHHEKIAKAIDASGLTEGLREVDKILNRNDVDSLMAEAKEDLNPKLAKQLEAELKQADAEHMPKEDYDKLVSSVQNLIDDFVDTGSERDARRTISRLYISEDVRQAVAGKGLLGVMDNAEGELAQILGKEEKGTQVAGRARPPRPSER